MVANAAFTCACCAKEQPASCRCDLYSIGPVCDHCRTSISDSANRPREGENAYYGSTSAYAIPQHNHELRRYIAAEDAASRRVKNAKKSDSAAPGKMHPRLAVYLRGVETGAIAAPWNSAAITYVDGVAHADHCRCGECSQRSRKPSALQIEIAAAVAASQAEIFARAARPVEVVPVEAVPAVVAASPPAVSRGVAAGFRPRRQPSRPTVKNWRVANRRLLAVAHVR